MVNLKSELTRPMGWSGRFLLSVSVLALLASCSMAPRPLTPEELARAATNDRITMYKDNEPLTGPLTVPDAIARALKFNLDKRAKMMDEAMASGQTDLDRFDLLPKMTVDAGYNTRESSALSGSRDSQTMLDSATAPTQSADRWTRTLNLGMSWNILDFGVSYFTARQNTDRVLIAAERRRKAVQTLVSDIRFAFWRAAAYQVLKDDVEHTVADTKGALERSRTVEKENLKAPVETLRYQKSLLETMRQLTAIQQELSIARIELAALINVPPGTEIVLVVPPKLTLPVWGMGLGDMEEAAFINNPDLREQEYTARIAVADTKKALLKLLPGITFTTDRKNDYNTYLVDNNWYELGAKVSWSLMNIVSLPSVVNAAEFNEDVVNARRIALRMAILAQVHISERQFRNTASQFEQSDDLWQVDKRLSEISDAKTESDAQGALERVASHASAIASQLRRFQTYAQTEQAFAKMQATLGRDLLPETVRSTNLKDVSKMVAARLDGWDKAEVKTQVISALATPDTENEGIGQRVSAFFGQLFQSSSVEKPVVAVEAKPATVEAVQPPVAPLAFFQRPWGFDSATAPTHD